MCVSHFLYVSHYLCSGVVSPGCTYDRLEMLLTVLVSKKNNPKLAVIELHDHRVCSEYLHLQDLAHKHAPRMLQG